MEKFKELVEWFETMHYHFEVANRLNFLECITASVVILSLFNSDIFGTDLDRTSNQAEAKIKLLFQEFDVHRSYLDSFYAELSKLFNDLRKPNTFPFSSSPLHSDEMARQFWKNENGRQRSLKKKLREMADQGTVLRRFLAPKEEDPPLRIHLAVDDRDEVIISAPLKDYLKSA